MKKFIALLIAFILVFSFASCVSTQPTSDETTDVSVDNNSELSFNFVVVDAEGNESDFEVPYADGQTVGEALLAECLISGEDSDYGLFVTTVNGITLDYEKDGKYWGFYIGDDFATTSVDLTDIVAGTTYKFVVTEG